MTRPRGPFSSLTHDQCWNSDQAGAYDETSKAHKSAHASIRTEMCERVRAIARRSSPQGVSDANAHRCRRDPSMLYRVRDTNRARCTRLRRSGSGDVDETWAARI